MESIKRGNTVIEMLESIATGFIRDSLAEVVGDFKDSSKDETNSTAGPSTVAKGGSSRSSSRKAEPQDKEDQGAGKATKRRKLECSAKSSKQPASPDKPCTQVRFGIGLC